MDDVMCSVFCERSVVYSASKTLFNLHYLSVTDEMVPHDAMSSGRFFGGFNRILFPVIVKAGPIMCEAAEPLHQFKISMMYDKSSQGGAPRQQSGGMLHCGKTWDRDVQSG
jgi:hypothetical protein